MFSEREKKDQEKLKGFFCLPLKINAILNLTKNNNKKHQFFNFKIEIL